MLIIGNGRMITRDKSHIFFENGAVAIDGNTIHMVGNTEEVKKACPGAEYIDAKGGLIMPAFINVHEHIYSAFARGLSIKGYNPSGFLDILDGQWWTIDRHLTLEQTRLSAYATYIDSIRNGVTTVFDHHASFGSYYRIFKCYRGRSQGYWGSVPACAMRFLTVMVRIRPEKFCYGERRIYPTCPGRR